MSNRSKFEVFFEVGQVVGLLFEVLSQSEEMTKYV